MSRASRIVCPSIEDNQGAIALAENPLSYAWSKHIDVRYHLVRELLRAKQVSIQFVVWEQQDADIWTKSLAATPCNITVSFC